MRFYLILLGAFLVGCSKPSPTPTVVASPAQSDEQKWDASYAALQKSRETSPTKTAMLFMVEDEPERFLNQCAYFDVQLKCDVEKWPDGDYVVQFRDDRGKLHGVDSVRFICSKQIADWIRVLGPADATLKARIFCQFYRPRMDKSQRQAVVGEVYMIEGYNDLGERIKRITDKGIADIPQG